MARLVGIGNLEYGTIVPFTHLSPCTRPPRCARRPSEALMGGRAHSLAIPSVDGFSGAGWDCLDVCADVWKAALNDNNLRNISGLQQNVKPAPFEPSLQPCPPRPRAFHPP